MEENEISERRLHIHWEWNQRTLSRNEERNPSLSFSSFPDFLVEEIRVISVLHVEIFRHKIKEKSTQHTIHRTTPFVFITWRKTSWFWFRKSCQFQSLMSCQGGKAAHATSYFIAYLERKKERENGGGLGPKLNGLLANPHFSQISPLLFPIWRNALCNSHHWLDFITAIHLISGRMLDSYVTWAEHFRTTV